MKLVVGLVSVALSGLQDQNVMVPVVWFVTGLFKAGCHLNQCYVRQPKQFRLVFDQFEGRLTYRRPNQLGCRFAG